MKTALIIASTCVACAQFPVLDSIPNDAAQDVDGQVLADRDGDGVADEADDCIDIADPLQRDFDRDGRGDACDVCPHLAESGEDRDGDGVGDACDPNPSTPSERRLWFDGFYDDSNGTPAGYAIGNDTGTWSISGHKLLTSNTTVDTYGRVLSITAQAAHSMTMTRMTITEIQTGQNQSAGVVNNFGGSHFVDCDVLPSSPSTLRIADRAASGTLTTSAATGLPPVSVGASFSLVAATHATAQPSCATGSVSVSLPATSYAAGSAGLRVHEINAEFDYLFVVELD